MNNMLWSSGIWILLSGRNKDVGYFHTNSCSRINYPHVNAKRKVCADGSMVANTKNLVRIDSMSLLVYTQRYHLQKSFDLSDQFFNRDYVLMPVCESAVKLEMKQTQDLFPSIYFLSFYKLYASACASSASPPVDTSCHNIYQTCSQCRSSNPHQPGHSSSICQPSPPQLEQD